MCCFATLRNASHHIAHSAIHHIDEVDASFCKGSNSYAKRKNIFFVVHRQTNGNRAARYGFRFFFRTVRFEQGPVDCFGARVRAVERESDTGESRRLRQGLLAVVQDKAKTLDYADAYRGFLTQYCAKRSHFKALLLYETVAYARSFNPCYYFLLHRTVTRCLPPLVQVNNVKSQPPDCISDTAVPSKVVISQTSYRCDFP